MKKCIRCKLVKFVKEFGKDKSRKDGLNVVCKVCNTIQVREARYKWKYGITKQRYAEMYQAQSGKCYICNKYYDILCVDHNHNTGEVRKLLCRQCNYILGIYKEDSKIFQTFIDYINLH